MKKTRVAAAVMLAVIAGAAQAETVTTLDGTFTVIESVAPLGAALIFNGGGNGLIGTTVWPTMADTPANRAFAVEVADHTWMQFDNYRSPGASGSINMMGAGGASFTSVIAVAGYDHDLGTPYEGMEFIIWASNDKTTWVEGTIDAIYRDGFDTASLLDNYSTSWTFGGGAYTYFSITGGDHLFGVVTGEGEIDALYGGVAAIPEPETYAMLLAGLGLLGFAARRRKQKETAAA